MKTLLLRYTSLFMALYLLNCSVDAPDVSHRENLKINEQESIVELVIEKGLGFDNAIAEYDDSDSENETSLKKSFSVDWYVLPDAIILNFVCNFERIRPIGLISSLVERPADLNSPPPEA